MKWYKAKKEKPQPEETPKTVFTKIDAFMLMIKDDGRERLAGVFETKHDAEACLMRFIMEKGEAEASLYKQPAYALKKEAEVNDDKASK